MYLYIGQNELLRAESVIGIFDLDHCTVDKRTREYLRRAEAEGLVVDAAGQLPRSFVVCTHPYHPQIVRLCPLSARALAARPEPWTSGNEP
ncbi:MAG: DUF370 domain-containing protein [Oscillibacter sp.]|nr:DUF370 domain-containing protein [Oscillibacter sp.]